MGRRLTSLPAAGGLFFILAHFKQADETKPAVGTAFMPLFEMIKRRSLQLACRPPFAKMPNIKRESPCAFALPQE
jgi:hypothetical protein